MPLYDDIVVSWATGGGPGLPGGGESARGISGPPAHGALLISSIVGMAVYLALLYFLGDRSIIKTIGDLMGLSFVREIYGVAAVKFQRDAAG